MDHDTSTGRKSAATACALGICMLLLSACASLSESQCRDADWERIGENDGARGVAQGRSVDHSKACAKYGVEFDEQAYFAGYQRGIERYCTPDNAVRVGLAGGSYAGVCPLELSPLFDSRYRAARAVYGYRQRVDELENRWRALEYDLDRARNDEQRRYIRTALYNLDQELRNARAQLYYGEQQLTEMTRGIL